MDYVSKKEFLAVDGDRTKTDTGWWNEYFQARERTLVKELGKLSPKLREKESHEM